MFDLWQEELTEEHRDELLDKAALEIKKRKMEMPALMMLELHKPLAHVGAQAAIVFSPFIVPFVGFDFMNDYSRLLSKSENIELLLQRLEQDQNIPPSGISEDACSTTTPNG